MLVGIKKMLVNLEDEDFLLRWERLDADQRPGVRESGTPWWTPQKRRNRGCIMNREALSCWAPAHYPVTGLAF